MELNIILHLAVFITIANVRLACCDKARHEKVASLMEYSDEIVVQKKDKRGIGECGGTWTSDSGTITSPSYPNDYGNFENCIYYITVSSGYVVELSFSAFQTEKNTDEVEIYDGGSLYTRQIETFSGNSIPQPVTTTGSSMTVRFRSDSFFTYSGFYATFRAITSEQKDEDCGGTFSADSGFLSSPNYPSHYEDDQDCYYLISVLTGNTIKLTFTSFRTETCCDTVKVYDGDGITDPLLGTFSGYSIPNTVTSSGSMLYIHFHSDKSSRYEGFYAVYDTKTNQDGSPSYYVCSDDSVHELGGLIYSHEDYPASYPELMTCVLTIFASAVYEKIYLKFVDVDLYHPLHVGCGSFDVIRVAEGDGEELGTICQDGDTDDYITASGSMVITFNAKDNTLNSDVRGFKAIFTAFYDTTYSWEDCSIDTDFHCNNRRCIYGKLRCDGYDNCGDNSDEENCVSSEVASVVGTSVGIIFVLVVIIIIVCICKRACSPTPAGRRSRGRPKRATTQPPPVNYSQGQVNVTPNPPQATYYGNAPPYPTGVQQNPAGYRQPAGYNPVIVPGPTYPRGPQQDSAYPQGPQQAQLYPTNQPYRAPTPVQGATDPAYPPPPAAYAPAFPQQPAPETLPPPSVPPPSYEEVTSASHGDSVIDEISSDGEIRKVM